MTLPRTGGRRRLRPRSAKQARRLDRARPIKDLAVARDGRCLLDRLVGHRCAGPLTPHHLLKQSAGTGLEVDRFAGIVALCSHGNHLVEDHPDVYWALGLVQRRGDTLDQCWARMHAAGLTPHAAPPPPPAHLCPYRPLRPAVPVTITAPDPW